MSARAEMPVSHTSLGQHLLGIILGSIRLFILWRELRSAQRLLQQMPDTVLSEIHVSRNSIQRARGR